MYKYHDFSHLFFGLLSVSPIHIVSTLIVAYSTAQAIIDPSSIFAPYVPISF
jgi:hypothetical protein